MPRSNIKYVLLLVYQKVQWFVLTQLYFHIMSPTHNFAFKIQFISLTFLISAFVCDKSVQYDVCEEPIRWFYYFMYLCCAVILSFCFCDCCTLLCCSFYTVKKGSPFSRPQPGCHWLNSPWESLVSDIPVGDGKIVKLFYSVYSTACLYWLLFLSLYRDCCIVAMQWSLHSVGRECCTVGIMWLL